MSTINIAIIAGVRAQYIKLASIQQAICEWNKKEQQQIRAFYINSGQHYDDDLSRIFIDELDIHFNYDLTGSYNNLRPINIFGDMIVKLYDVLAEIPQPLHWVIVFGDANTTLAGALAATRKGVRLIHIESGQRSGYKSPEEVNRVTTDHISDVKFVSSKFYLEKLTYEGIVENVFWTGDIVYDLLKGLEPSIPPGIKNFNYSSYILASIHREENVLSDQIMMNIMEILDEYSEPVAFVAHPRVRKRLKELGMHELKNVTTFNTFSYHEMIAAIKGCKFLITDSGAFQRESYYLHKRCLTRQNEPHWESLIQAGIHKTIGFSKDDIRSGIYWIENELNSEYPQIDDFGNGTACNAILNHIVSLTKRYYNL